MKFGKRNNIWSLTDGQVCADHDRSEGEGVGPQEYTIIKLEVLEFPGALAPLADKAGKVFLAPATLRPETMYGQTNCFALPEGKYGAYEHLNGDVFIISERAARGFACQGYTEEFGKTKCLMEVKGMDLMGVPLKGEREVNLALPCRFDLISNGSCFPPINSPQRQVRARLHPPSPHHQHG